MAYDLLGQSKENNESYVRLYGILHVTNNYISWSRGSASVHTSGLQPIGTYYGRGDHTVITRDFTFGHDSNGNFSVYIGASLSTTFVSGDCGGTLNLPHINRQSTINSFTGTAINKDFKATYTPHTNYENRLRISIPHVVVLETYRNYASGTAVRLSQASINYIRNYTKNKTIQLGGVIETWNGGTKIGESSEITINVKIPKGLRVKVSGTWKEAIPYVRVNGAWKEARPHVRVSNQWKEGI